VRAHKPIVLCKKVDDRHAARARRQYS
jgi:hypothetical protein